MVLKRIRNFLEIHTDYLKLSLRNRKKSVHCPMCNRNISKISTIVLCKKCDEKFSKYSEDVKKILVEKIKSRPNKTRCFLCNKKDLKLDDRLIYCADCDVSFHA
jgi:Zn finger protein HypA/HybF involved in hydrogenase expression